MKKSKDATQELKDSLIEPTDEQVQGETAQGDNVEALAEELSDSKAQNDALLATVIQMQNQMNAMQKAINTPVILGEGFETGDHKAGIDQDITNEGVIEASLHGDPNSKQFKDKADYLAFMKEEMTIRIETTSDKDADQVIGMSVNGDSHVFLRGVPKTCPRYIVNAFAMAKPITYKNEEYVGKGGILMSRQPGTSGLRYNFSVVKDVNRIGTRWLAQVLALAA